MTSAPDLLRPARLMLWSAPRSRSTAFFRMMAERGDFTVVHEPFSYLGEFGHTDVGGTRVSSAAELLGALRGFPGPVFAKETTGHRYPEVVADPAFLSGMTHTFLIRDPRETIPSYLNLYPGAPVEKIGYESLHEIYTAVTRLTEREPVVIDAGDLMRNPAGTVAAYCAGAGIPFIPEALTWEPAQRPEWQPSRRWHEAVAASSGLGTASVSSPDPGPGPAVSAYLRHHLPYYEALRAGSFFINGQLRMLCLAV
ncbi:MAG: sulfotransferase family protein [Trebonia sp.]